MGDGILYTVLVAVVGMLIVFSFLLLLSMLMVATKRALGDREQESATASDVSALRTASGPVPGRGAELASGTAEPGGPPPWLFAAVVAFVFAEQEAHSAQPWIRGRRQ